VIRAKQFDRNGSSDKNRFPNIEQSQHVPNSEQEIPARETKAMAQSNGRNSEAAADQ
jgi:hypothetical protein